MEKPDVEKRTERQEIPSIPLEKRFTYHPPTPEQRVAYERIRGEAGAFAMAIAALCPTGREAALAITKLEECVMWANAAVARGGTPSMAPTTIDPGRSR
jgi:hypothetical protein